MEEQMKREALSKLYTLRAGLSSVALEKEKADEIYEEYDGKLWEISEEISKNKSIAKQSLLSDGQKAINDEITNCQNQIEENNKKISNFNEKLEAMPAKHKKKNIITSLCTMLLLVGITMAIVGLLGWLGVIQLTEKKFGEAWLGILALCCGIISFIGIPFYIVFSFSSFYDFGFETKRYFNKEIASTNNTIKVLEEENIKLQNKIQECKSELLRQSQQDLQIRLDIERANQQIKKLELSYSKTEKQQEEDKDIRLHEDAGRFLYEGLKKQFATFLDERDWENVDYVIYTIETGRADSLKEALQLVDNERRANRIIDAVQIATQSICTTFVAGMNYLGSLVTDCCQGLSRQLNYVGAQVQSQNDMMYKRFDEVSSRVKGLVTETQLNNALQKKANETSLQIVSSIKGLKKNN